MSAFSFEMDLLFTNKSNRNHQVPKNSTANIVREKNYSNVMRLFKIISVTEYSTKI